MRLMRYGIIALLVTGVAAAQAGTIETVAGAGGKTNNGDAGKALDVNIGQTFGVEFGPDGALYVCEVENHRVWRVDVKTGMAKVVAGSGRKGYDGDGGPATKASMNEPYEVRFDSAGNMYVVERVNAVVRRVDGKTGVITTIAGTGKPGFSGDGGPATSAQFNQPHSIALDEAKGHLYVADIINHRIRRVDLKSGTIETVAGTGAKKQPEDGKVARGLPMAGPRALYVTEADRTLWIALREGNSVWKMELDTGVLHHVAGTGKSGWNADKTVTMAEAMFAGPKGIVVDRQGRVFVADTENQATRMIVPKAGKVVTIAGGGPKSRGLGGDGGEATAAKMDRPHGICFGPDGRVYMGDTNNHRVRAIQVD